MPRVLSSAFPFLLCALWHLGNAVLLCNSFSSTLLFFFFFPELVVPPLIFPLSLFFLQFHTSFQRFLATT